MNTPSKQSGLKEKLQVLSISAGLIMSAPSVIAAASETSGRTKETLKRTIDPVEAPEFLGDIDEGGENDEGGFEERVLIPFPQEECKLKDVKIVEKKTPDGGVKMDISFGENLRLETYTPSIKEKIAQLREEYTDVEEWWEEGMLTLEEAIAEEKNMPLGYKGCKLQLRDENGNWEEFLELDGLVSLPNLADLEKYKKAFQAEYLEQAAQPKFLKQEDLDKAWDQHFKQLLIDIVDIIKETDARGGNFNGPSYIEMRMTLKEDSITLTPEDMSLFAKEGTVLKDIEPKTYTHKEVAKAVQKALEDGFIEDWGSSPELLAFNKVSGLLQGLFNDFLQDLSEEDQKKFFDDPKNKIFKDWRPMIEWLEEENEALQPLFDEEEFAERA